MSKLQVQGNASGTGVITLAAPNTNSDVTLTLPAVTAELITNSSGVLNIGSGQVYKDADGNVGIGNIEPLSYLDVGDTSSTASMNSSGAGQFRIRGGEQTLAFAISSVNLATIYTNSNSGALAFGTNEIERTRIDSSGNFLVGTTSVPTAGGGGLAVYSFGAIVTSRSTTSGSGHHEFRNPNGLVGQISTSGSATTYATSSDYRLKENVAPMTGALEFVRKQRPVTYTWKADGSEGSGYIAHWMQEDGAGNCVTGEKDAVDSDGNPQYQGIDTSFMVAPLNAAISELADIVDQQQTLIADLTTRLEALEAI